MSLVRDIFVGAAERDIHCGDGLVIEVITADSIERMNLSLRTD